MKLECYVYPGWDPRIRPAGRRRAWMDDTPEQFAYRCLPLAMANSHGWEVANAIGFSARWHGGSGVEAVEIVTDEERPDVGGPVSLFGQGTITFHLAGLLRTEAGWNLWVGGPPNHAKDGIAPLSGLIETDWSPYSFTINWRFTRPDHWVRFEPGEPIAFFFPVERGKVDSVAPQLRPIAEAPELQRQFEAWSRSRDAFHTETVRRSSARPEDRWQQLYYNGVDPDGVPGVADHQTKLRARPFARGSPADPLAPGEASRCPGADAPVPEPTTDQTLILAKRDWLLGVQEDLRALSPRLAGIERVRAFGADAFLDRYYAAGRPAILCGEMQDWPALAHWSPDYLAEKIGPVRIDYQGGRTDNARFELESHKHLRHAPFDEFMRLIAEPGNDAYVTANNSAANRAALAPLWADMGRIDKLLAHGPDADEGMLWIGPEGSFTPLHHDLTNNLLAQVVGRKRVILVPATQVGRLGNREHVFSAASDLTSPDGRARLPEIDQVRCYDVTLMPGEILFIPIGWWHQVHALDFSVSATYTNFRWRNDWYEGYPRP